MHFRFFFISVIFLFPVFVFSYEPEVTHVEMSRKSVRVLERLSVVKYSEAVDNISSIANGSRDEDTFLIEGLRGPLHFYYPPTGEGLHGIPLSALVVATPIWESAIASYNAFIGTRNKKTVPVLKWTHLIGLGEQYTISLH